MNPGITSVVAEITCVVPGITSVVAEITCVFPQITTVVPQITSVNHIDNLCGSRDN